MKPKRSFCITTIAVWVIMSAILTGCSDSDNSDPQAATPQITLRHGGAGVDVSITSATEGAAIFYGVDDDTTPTAYAGTVTLTDRKSHKIYAIARKDGYRDSVMATSNVIQAGSVIFFSDESWGAPPSSVGDPPPPPDTTTEDVGINLCDNSDECSGDVGSIGGLSVFFATWQYGGTSGNGPSVRPNQSACNVIGCVTGTTVTSLKTVKPPPPSGAIYFMSPSINDIDSINTANPVLSVTPPMSDGNYFTGEAAGCMKKCNINTTTGNCTNPFNNLGHDINALALDPFSTSVWAGTDQGVLLKCSVANANSCATITTLDSSIQSILADNQGNIYAATSSYLYSCPYGQGSCSQIQQLYPASGNTNQMVMMNNSIYLATGNSYIQVFPLPLNPFDTSQIWPCGQTNITDIATDGQYIYFSTGSSLLATYKTDGNGNCSTWTTNSASAGTSGSTVAIMGVVQSWVMDPNPLTETPTSLNLTTDEDCDSCTVPQITFTNTMGSISFPTGAPVNFTTTCSGPQSSCTVNFSPFIAGESGVLNYTDGFHAGTIPYSCSKAAMMVSPSQFMMTASTSVGICTMSPISLGNVWGSLSLVTPISPSPLTLDCSQCTGAYPQACNVSVTTAANTAGEFYLSDGNSNSDSIAFNCYPPTMSCPNPVQNIGSLDGDPCNVTVDVYNTWGTVLYSMPPPITPVSTCTGPQAHCTLSWDQPCGAANSFQFYDSGNLLAAYITVQANCSEDYMALSQTSFSGSSVDACSFPVTASNTAAALTFMITSVTPNQSWYYPIELGNTCTDASSSCSFTYYIPAGGSASVTVSDGHTSIPTQMTCNPAP